LTSHTRIISVIAKSLVSLLLAAVSLCPIPGVASEVVLYSFNRFNQAEGFIPSAGLFRASDGNFYGTTELGGALGGGTVFKVTPSGILTTLQSFAYDGPNGFDPQANVFQGSDGNFYGTAASTNHASGGSVFRITPSGTLTVLHVFTGMDGSYPTSGVVEGSDGSFYGTTEQGGTTLSSGYPGYGSVYKITAGGTLTTLHSFTDIGSDGAGPYAGLVHASDGNFYGTTYGGGVFGAGTIFKLTPNGAFATLHSFALGLDGAAPFAGLIEDSSGNFYGTTLSGGTAGFGSVFEITPSGILTTLNSFTNTGMGGYWPTGLVQGSDGNFYGTTQSGGTSRSGTIFEITPGGTLTSLHSFADSPDGSQPYAGLIQDPNGIFYGTTRQGGTYGEGTVFAFAPNGYIVVPSAGVGGSLNVSTPQVVPSGGSLRLMATPNAGDFVNQWMLDGVAVQSGGLSYTLSNVTANHTVSVAFAQSFTVTPSAGFGGSISPSTAQTVAMNSSIALTATPVTHYAVKQWTLDGFVVQTGGTTYALSNVTTNHTISVSFVATSAPSPPTALTAIPGNGKVTLSWTASVGATSYRVYRGTTSYGQSATPIAAGIVGTTYTNSGLTNGTTYYYRVAAFNPAGNSAEGNQAAAKPLPPPATPTGLTATAGVGKVTLSWTGSARATSYSIYRGTTSYGQSATPIASGIVGTTDVNTGLTHGTTYFYRVAAFNSAGNSPEGNQASATP